MIVALPGLFSYPFFSIRLYQLSLITRRGVKAGGSLHPLLASGLASPLQLQDRRQAENRRRQRGRRYHRRHRLYNRHHNISPDHATRTQLPSPHRRSSPDQHRHQHLPSHHHRRKPEKSLQHQRQIARSSTAPSTRIPEEESTRRISYPREIRPPGRSQQQASWKRRCNH